MKTMRRMTPEGTRDLLFEECAARRRVETTLTDLFRRTGFGEVMTPGLEYLDVFAAAADGSGHGPRSLPPESMYKLTDAAGRLLVMRPDATLPIARLVSARLAGAALPLRLYYAQDIWRWGAGLSGHDSQQLQAGVELIGTAGNKADLEILALAAQSLTLCLGDGFRLEIGHAGFWGALLDELEADAETGDDLRALIETKNYAALGNLLDALPPSPAADAVRRLPRLFGGEEVLIEAAALCHTPGARAALEYLETLYRQLCAMGLQGQIILDLGLVNRQEYYTGVIFRGYAEGGGDAVVSGGRYDTLLGQYGGDLPATGFGINIDALSRVLLRREGVVPLPPPAVLVHAAPGSEPAALKRVSELAAQGVVCEHSVFSTPDEAREYACDKGIKKVEIV